MLEQVLTEIHNWFQVGIYHGAYTIKDGSIALPFLQDGQYFRILGSVFNNGLYRYGPEMELLHDETFTGSIWALAIPREVERIAKERSEIEAKITDVTASFADSAFTSESYAGYSYSKDQTGQIAALTAQKAEITKRLNAYRKLREV